MTISLRLKKWRQILGVTQIEFCEQANIALGVLKKYEAGTSIPGGETLSKMANTGLNIHWLLTGEGSMSSDTGEDDEQKSLTIQDLPQLQRYEKRLEAILKLMADIENEQERDALISEIFARVSSAKQLDELKQLVTKLSINQAKTG